MRPNSVIILCSDVVERTAVLLNNSFFVDWIVRLGVDVVEHAILDCSLIVSDGSRLVLDLLLQGVFIEFLSQTRGFAKNMET